VSTVSTWHTVLTHVTVWTVFTVQTGWTDGTLWTGWGLAGADTVVAFSVWLFNVAKRSDFFSHSDFDFIFRDDLSVDIKSGGINKQFFVPFASDAVVVNSFKVVLNNRDDGVDVELSLDQRVQSGNIFSFDVSVWVRVTVGDDDNDLFPAGLFSGSNSFKNLLETDVQEGTFVEGLEGVKFGGECTVAQVFFEFDVHPGLFSVSDNRESGVNAHFVVVVDVSSDEIDSEFHFVPGVSYARCGVEEYDVVGSASFIFWWFAIAFAFAVGSAVLGWGKGESAGHESRQENERPHGRMFSVSS
jgi:hypothetical protein